LKIAILGGAGFVGSNLANYLNSIHDVTVIDNLSFGFRENINGVKFIQKDFADVDLDYDVLVHCACANIIYAMEAPIDTFKVNALDTIKMIEKFKGKIIYTSTASVYGQAKVLPTPENHPLNVSNAYDQSKLITEHYLKLRGNYTTLRLSNVYGHGQRPENPYSGVIGKFIDAGLKGKTMYTYGNGADTRDYTYIDDVVLALDMAIESEPLNTEVNISTGKETSINELILLICNELEIPINMRSTEKRQIDKISRRMLDNSKARELLGWKPFHDLKKGIKLTIEHEKNKQGRG
jgi:UDP-glucose 4-epimerase